MRPGSGPAPLPDEARIRWRRIDVPGREDASIARTLDGWRLSGEVEVLESGVAARLAYFVECDAEWHSRGARIEGSANGAPVRLELVADGCGAWTCGGEARPDLEGALDVDLAFTPATNLLPIRRLGLRVGERADVRAAWLRFPELALEPLEQTYVREAECVFRFRTRIDGEPFEARLDVDLFGRIARYEGLWEAESPSP